MKQYLIVCTLLLMAATAVAQDNNPLMTYDVCVLGVPSVGHAGQFGQSRMYKDILHTVYDGVDISLEYKSLPYSRALQCVRDARIQCTLSVKDRYTDVFQGAVPMALYDLVAVHRRSTEYESADSLAKKRVAYVHGFDWQQYIPVEVFPQKVYELGSAFLMLERGHVDYVIGDRSQLMEVLPESSLPESEIHISSIRTLEVCPIFTPSEDGRRLKEVYDQRMKELIDSGALDRIYRKYGINAPEFHDATDNLRQ